MSKQQQGAAVAPRSGLGNTTNFPASQRGSGAKPTFPRKRRVKVDPSLWQERIDQAEAERLQKRFRLLDQAQRVLPEDKHLAACMRAPQKYPKQAPFVDLMWDAGNNSAGYRKLCRCANGKLCAVCAAHLGEKKREEAAAGVLANTDRGGWLGFMTLTASHSLEDELDDLIERFDAAYNDMRTRRPYRAALDAWGGGDNVKFIIAWEITWGPLYGWHYHRHIIVFVLDQSKMTMEPDEFSQIARVEWTAAAARQGLRTNEHGFDFAPTRGAVADYIAKWGHEPEARPWGVEDEATKAHSKSARVVISGAKKHVHLTPFQMLALLDEGITHVYGHDLAALFRAYAKATKGKPQLRWSRGLRAALGLKKEKTDEELLEEGSETSVCLGKIKRKHWREGILANDARADLLLYVRKVAGDFDKVAAWLALLGVRLIKPRKKRVEAS